MWTHAVPTGSARAAGDLEIRLIRRPCASISGGSAVLEMMCRAEDSHSHKSDEDASVFLQPRSVGRVLEATSRRGLGGRP